jgi:hypothetical protein
MELENNKKINFIGITISRTSNTSEFHIFRKPTYTDTIIPQNSCHPTEHKFAALRYFINRLNTYQLNLTEKNNERLIIRNIAYNNGFPLEIIDNLMKNNQRKKPQLRKRKRNDKNGSHILRKRNILNIKRFQTYTPTNSLQNKRLCSVHSKHKR